MSAAGEKLVARIAHLNPCKEATAWLREQQSAQQAWDSCQDARWMLWLLGKQIRSAPWSDDRKPFLACCLDVAEMVKHLWPKSQSAIAVLRQWIDGTADVDAAKQARRDLCAAAAYAAYAADDTAYAAAYAAEDAADDAAYAAAYAADDAADDDAAYAAAAAAAKAKSLSASADIVRRHYPTYPRVAKAKVTA